MLKGLEISEVSFGDVGLRTSDFRIESEYFTQELIALDRLIDSKNFVPLKDVSSKISDGTHFTPEYVSKGVPFLSAINVKSNVFDLNAGFQHITQEAHNALYRRCDPREGDVLVRKVGAGARMACVIPQLGFQFSIFVSVAMIRTKGIDPYYLSTFINTRIGQRQLLRFNKGIGQPDLHLEDLARLRIFRASCEFQSEIARVVIKANWLIESATVQYGEAEQSLLAELGFDGWTPTEESVSVKNCSDFMSAGRFDAEYFQPKYDEIVAKIKTYSGGTIKAASVLITGLVNESEDTPERYVELADIGVSGEIEGCTNAMFGELPSRARQRMATGQVIASSIEGSLDRCALVTPEYDKALCSTGFHRFCSQDINPETMLLLFKSWPIQQLMKRGCSGTILCGILPAALEHVDLPMVNPDVQKVLAAKVRESFALRAESKRLLDLAKHAVEVAIEQGEEKAMEALEKEIGHAN